MEKVRSFKKVERSYHSTPNGWRLATWEEAMNGLETIKEQHHLKEWDRARLLDGWISGSGYGYEIKNEFRGCMGYMLLIETDKSAEDESDTPYADVKLSQLGKEVALFLCVDDWNLEVVYWLLNSWSKSDTMMKLSDVSGGNLPFANAAEFKKMNEDIGRLARRLGDEEVAAREKARMTNYSGTDSVEEVLSGMMQIVIEEEERTGNRMRDFSGFCGHKYYLPGFAQTGDVAEVFWSFVCETFAGFIVEDFSVWRLETIRRMETKDGSKKNWVEATCNLEWLSYYRSDIVHEPLKHACVGNNCIGPFLSDAEQQAAGDLQKFKELINHNAKWRCYDITGNYGVLNKLLSAMIIYKKWVTVEDVDMLLKCSAEPAGCYTIRGKVKNTNLHNVAEFSDKDKAVEFARLLLEACDDEESRTRFVNAVNENGMTALHIASEWRNSSLCEVLIEFNGSVNAQDNKGMTPLHYALEGERDDELINVLMRSSQAAESVDLRDKRGNAPLDEAIEKKDYDLIAKWLPMSKEAEHYLNKVDDQKQLLRYSLLVGAPDTFEKLYENGIKLPAGDSDEDGKTALHRAAMLDNDDSARQIILSTVKGETKEQVIKMLTECDRRKRTVLHEAALNGHENLCKILLEINPKLLYMKDRDRRNPLYDLAKGKYKGTALTTQWLNEWEKRGMHMEDLIDRSGLTPLHVAVSQGNVEFVKILLSNTRFKSQYLSRGDFLGQTALHKAAKRGDIETVEILLEQGAHPLRERDCDGRTALHYAVQAEIGDKQKMAEAIFKRCKSTEEISLLSWASAAGLGTADQNLSKDDPLREFLLQKKSVEVKKDINLLRMAASAGDIEMTKELIIKGYPIGDILDSDWKENLDAASQHNVTRVSNVIDTIKDQGNDRPAVLDTLGRVDYAQGIAALLLNPYTRPPIAVGITGTWGMGKSSLMLQTEQILLTTAAQMALLESSKLPSAALELPNIKSFKLTRKGGKTCKNIYNQITCGESINRNLNMKQIQKELEEFLNKKYDRKLFQSLAAMDSSGMFEPNAPGPIADPSAEENVPAVLTVQYNAWKYRNDTEALAGMAVEITKELEGLMSQAQWLSTCCRNAWRTKKYNLWFEIFFPSILALVLVSSLTWIIWVVFDNEKLKEWGKTKYAWPPAAIIVIVWTVTNSVMGVLKPVSSQLMQYISFPDHSDKLGYQETVISDITFLKEEIGKRAYGVFIVFGLIFTTFTVLWHLITESWLWTTSLFVHHESLEKSICVPKVNPASGNNLRIIVFVDDLDRCQESVILQVLSAINLVLAECEINVVMGMDKRLIQRAIMKQYGDDKKTSQELADMYLQKIIQLPLDLPDPSDEESRRFLKAQLGVYEHREEAPADSGAPSNEESGGERREAEQQIAAAQVIDISETGSPSLSVAIQATDDKRSSRGDSEKNCFRFLKFPVRNVVRDYIDGLRALWRTKIQTGPSNLPEKTKPTETGEVASSQTDNLQNSSSSILIREMLFVRYSQGEEDAFFYFQRLATESRKLPREWKRLLNYHRLVWYIFSVGKEAKTLAGWQVQLIAWIFVCWEWQENMNLVIQKWNEIKDLKTSESNEPSLLMIVEHLIEEHERENRKMAATGNEEEEEELNENTDDTGNVEKDINKLDALEKSLAEIKKEMKRIKEPASDDLKEEMKELMKQVSDELKEEIGELKKQVFDLSRELKEEMKGMKKQMSYELKKDINDIREQMLKKKIGKNKRNMENAKVMLHNLANWKRMQSTLERYNVSMDGIQAFQRFRFYCMAGFLPRPSSKE